MSELNDLQTMVDDSIGEMECQDIITDEAGTVFNEAFHRVDENGHPMLTPKGRFKKIPKDKIEEKAKQINSEARQAAIESANLFFVLNILSFGDFGKPEKQEKEGIEAVLESYYVENGVVKLPSWLGVTIALGVYTGARVTNPDAIKIFKGKINPILTKIKSMKKEPVATYKEPKDDGV